MKTKLCTKCGIIKNISEFSKQKNGKFGVISICKVCDRLRGKKYYLNNKENVLKNHRSYRKQNPDYDRNYYKNNLDKKKQYTEKNKDKIQKSRRLYLKKNRKRLNKYIVDKRKKDINFKLSHNLVTYINHALKDNCKSKRTLELLGCSIKQLKNHLEIQFKEGMTWENYGYYGWHIDHIKPRVLFNLSIPEEQQKCFHYSNLQPLWRKDNQSKGDRYSD